jgi:hypothetical protein
MRPGHYRLSDTQKDHRMRTEIAALVAEIKESLELLRRHL